MLATIMSFEEMRDGEGNTAVAEKDSFFVAPSMQAGREGEATMVFLFPCSDYSLIRSNVSRFVENTFGLPAPPQEFGSFEALSEEAKQLEPA